MPQPGEEPLLEFLEVMRRLRAECPWKAEQTHRSLARYLVEETHETVEAIETGDGAHLREELGDLLLQVYFHAVIAEEAGEFTLDDVASDITAKMLRRNPHVFGDAPRDLDPAAVNELWESVKATEKERTSVTEGIAPTLPALLYADKVLARLARVETSSPAPLVQGPAVVEEVAQQPSRNPVPDPHSIGARLLALVAEARAVGVDPEQALRDAVRARAADGPSTSPDNQGMS